ncbi:hypothetical protein [Roseixanthobacter pseudopolyaromaticivorans]|uniref:hypothetical protein n=1 Tax=Xanthobacteraceae TaxID=335928 RepID=UPI003728797D
MLLSDIVNMALCDLLVGNRGRVATGRDLSLSGRDHRVLTAPISTTMRSWSLEDTVDASERRLHCRKAVLFWFGTLCRVVGIDDENDQVE